MRRTMVWGLTLALGVGLVGCQNTRTGATSSTQPSMAQSNGWDKSTPVTQTGATTNGSMNLGNRSALSTGSTSTMDPNAFPRTPDTMPRNVGNQTSQYNMPGQTMPGSFQQPAPGMTQSSGFATQQPTSPATPMAPAPQSLNLSPPAPASSSGVMAPPPPRSLTGLNDPFPPPADLPPPRAN